MFIRNLFSFLGLGVLSIILTTRTSAAPQGVAQESPPAKAPAKTKPEVQSGSRLDGHLKRVETITSPTEMASSFFNSLRCDDDGNVYFRTDLDGTSGIHKLNKKSRESSFVRSQLQSGLQGGCCHIFCGGTRWRGSLRASISPRDKSICIRL